MGDVPENGVAAEPGECELAGGVAECGDATVAFVSHADASDPAGDMPESAAEPSGPEQQRYRFFNHAACEFYPCHDMPAEQLNCLFCYCPLYALGEGCGGNFTYAAGADGARIKDCSACTLPHRVENYDYIVKRLGEKRV